MMDSKVYELHGRQVRISVVETTRPERALRQRAALVDAQRRIAEHQQLDDVLLFVVDVRRGIHMYSATSRRAPEQGRRYPRAGLVCGACRAGLVR